MPSKPKQPQTAPQAEQAIRRAREAEALLENPLLQEAFEKLEGAYTQAFLNTNYDDAEGRERCFRMTHAVQQVRSQLQEVVTNGKLQTSRVQNTVKGV